MGYLNSSTALAVCGVCLLFYAGNAIYNVFLNPLKEYPGPTRLAISRIPVTLATLRGRRAQFRYDLHRKYGEIVRVAPDELSYAHNQGWRDIYSTQAKVNPTRAIRGVEQEGAHSVVLSDGEVHTRQKRMITSIFSERILKENEPLFVRYVDLLMDKLREADGQPLALADWYNFTTFDVIGDLLFGESLDMLAHSQYIPWVKSIPDFLRAFASIVVLYEYRLFRALWLLLPPKLLRSLQETHFQYTREKLDRYLKTSEKERSGIMRSLLDGGNHKGMFLPELYSNAPILVFGGSETAATQLRCLTFLLLKNPPMLHRLVTEIRTAFPTSDKLGYDSLLELKYLNACIEEGLRVYPPCTNALPRIVAPGGATICGEYVPGGTNVSVATYALHRSNKYFHLPDSFIPDRWLDGAEKRDPRFANDEKDVVMPFSYGPHNCPGKKMGYFEIRLILAKLLWHFDLQLILEDGGEKDSWDDMENYQTWCKRPLRVRAVAVK